MANIKYLLFLFLIVSWEMDVYAQDRYAVFYKYKPQNGYTLANPAEYLSSEALLRRQKETLAIDSLDLPVSQKYIDQIAAKSDYLLYHSKWLNASVVIANDSQVKEIGVLPFVDRIELVAHSFSAPPSGRLKNYLRVTASATVKCDSPKLNTRELELSEYNYDYQNQLLGIDKMHEEGFTGKGVRIAVLDAGFLGVNTTSPFAYLFTNNRIVAQKDVVRPWNPEVYTDHQHGTNTLSLIGANEEGKLVSGAYDAEFVLVITEEYATEYRIEEFNWVRGAEFADSLGVDIISSSLGYLDFDDPSMTYSLADLDGKTTTITKGAVIASKKGILVVNSIGNYGSLGASSLLAPADAAEVLAIGSVKKDLGVSTFSSRGPTGDGRLKPDLAAFGDSPILIRSDGSAGASGGTSFSAPQIAALAAGLIEAKPEWTKAQLVENLLRSATQFDNPDNELGYGIPNFYDAYYGEILGVEEEEISWKVYPNPLAEEELKIFFGIGTEVQFELVDMSGRVLLQHVLTRTQSKLPYIQNLNGLTPGVYLIRLQEGNLVKQTKLLKH